MSPANHSLGGVSGLSGILEGDDIPGLSRKSSPQNIIDVTPECLEFAKLGKSKVLITLDRGVDRGGTTMFVLAFVAEVTSDSSLDFEKLGVWFVEATQVAAQNFKARLGEDKGC
jgi:hypothetical protein